MSGEIRDAYSSNMSRVSSLTASIKAAFLFEIKNISFTIAFVKGSTKTELVSRRLLSGYSPPEYSLPSPL